MQTASPLLASQNFRSSHLLRPVARSRPAIAAKARNEPLENATQSRLSLWSWIAPSSLLLDGPLHADELPPPTNAAASSATSAFASASAAVDAVTSTAPAPDDPVISVLFGFAIAALSVMTLGVAYLSFATWQDSQQESQDRLRTGPRSSRPTPRNSKSQNGISVASGEDDTGVAGRRKKRAPAPKSSKGFGAK